MFAQDTIPDVVEQTQAAETAGQPQVAIVKSAYPAPDDIVSLAKADVQAILNKMQAQAVNVAEHFKKNWYWYVGGAALVGGVLVATSKRRT